MDNLALNDLLKKYVSIFLDEYAKYLDRDQLEIIKSINYEQIIHYHDLTYPLGIVNFNQIYLSNSIDSLIKAMKNMPNYGTSSSHLNNKNYSSYLKYICDNGYTSQDYYADQLMYFIFKLVIKNNSGLIDGLINKEIHYLSNKYKIRMVNLYKREEVIADKVINIISHRHARQVLFMDKTSAFKYLNDNLGYRYASLFHDVGNLVDENYQVLFEKNYQGFHGIIDYAKDYDGILYGDVYNYLLDFSVNNQLSILD